MATLTVIYDTTTGKCTYSGLSAAMPDAMRRKLTRLGIELKSGENVGHLLDKHGFNAAKRGAIVQEFNDKYNNTTNLPFGGTEAVTLTLTSV